MAEVPACHEVYNIDNPKEFSKLPLPIRLDMACLVATAASSMRLDIRNNKNKLNLAWGFGQFLTRVRDARTKDFKGLMGYFTETLERDSELALDIVHSRLGKAALGGFALDDPENVADTGNFLPLALAHDSDSLERAVSSVCDDVHPGEDVLALSLISDEPHHDLLRSVGFKRPSVRERWPSPSYLRPYVGETMPVNIFRRS